MGCRPPLVASVVHRHDGFTIIEVLVASFVLIVGMLGVLTLLTGALRTTSANNERVAATNLGRELVEETRGLLYDDMSGAVVQARLQARGYGSGTPWTIERRGVTYAIAATSCTFDDPADKLAATAPDGVCMPQPAGITGDSNGEDFRRTTFRISWSERGGIPRSITQTTLIGNPSGGLGPRILSFAPVTQTITANVSSVSVAWTTTAAQSLRWAVDDGASAGNSSGSTSFTTSWEIGSSGSGSEVLDGAYQITAQPFDDRDIAGEVKRAQVALNRRQPYVPTSFAGGYDTRLATLVDIPLVGGLPGSVVSTLVGGWVDLQWSPNRERDILGYTVVWAGLDGIVGNGDDEQVCPAPAGGTMLPPSATSCAAPSQIALATKYYVVAVDRAPDNQLRAGDRATLTIGAAGARPAAPAGPLTVQTVNDEPKLTWSPPPSGSVLFYRIYRDGSGLDDRYDRTTGGATTYVDEAPGSVGHSYRVTAVNSVFNESNLLGPVSWSP